RIAEKRRSLALHDAFDLAALTAQAPLASTVVHAVLILIATRFIEGIAIGAIAESRTFVLNRKLQYRMGGFGEALPVSRGEVIATALWVDTGVVQNFSRVDITDSRDGPLI